MIFVPSKQPKQQRNEHNGLNVIGSVPPPPPFAARGFEGAIFDPPHKKNASELC
jgi:hypothetical protein